jgi:hypothetical protein
MGHPITEGKGAAVVPALTAMPPSYRLVETPDWGRTREEAITKEGWSGHDVVSALRAALVQANWATRVMTSIRSMWVGK